MDDAVKQRLELFFNPDEGEAGYGRCIQDMMAKGGKRLVVDMAVLRRFDPHIARAVIDHPESTLDAAEELLKDRVNTLDPKYLVAHPVLKVGFEGPFGFNRVTPRELLSSKLSKMVRVDGIVTKCSLVKPKISKSVQYCRATGGFTPRQYADVTSNGLPTGSAFPTRDDAGNALETEFGLCQYRDHQTVVIQEMPETAPPGQLPRSVEVILEDDLTDTAKPGDRVSVTGVFKAPPQRATGATSGVVRPVLVGNNVQRLSKSMEAPRFTDQDVKNITELRAWGRGADGAPARDPQDRLLALLGRSLAPSIYGHGLIKQALVLQLVGGCEKNLANGTHLRGDINLLMVGDPGVAKSQLLRAVMGVAPLAVSTTGRGSSGVGLTAAVTSDAETGERRLEAGAMVLADRGVVCIDEFDKMNDVDRVAIHEVMEQQTVTISKAGIHASLNARCSVVAAANPVMGSYSADLSITENINLPDSLLSRFDLLFVVLDHKDHAVDRTIAEHVLRIHQWRNPREGMPPEWADDDAEGDVEDDADGDGCGGMFVRHNRRLHGPKRMDILTPAFLRKYVHFVKERFQPELTDEAMGHIAERYAELRANNGEKSLPVTARTLECIIRLATAHAKVRQSESVTAEDVEGAMAILDYALCFKRSDADMALGNAAPPARNANKRGRAAAEAPLADATNNGGGGGGAQGGGDGAPGAADAPMDEDENAGAREPPEKRAREATPEVPEGVSPEEAFRQRYRAAPELDARARDAVEEVLQSSAQDYHDLGWQGLPIGDVAQRAAAAASDASGAPVAEAAVMARLLAMHDEQRVIIEFDANELHFLT